MMVLQRIKQMLSNKEVPTGESTKPQIGRVKVAGYGSLRGNGFGTPSKSTYAIMRRMRNNPSVAIARMAAYAPIKGAGWTVDSEDGAKQEWIDFIEEVMLPMRSHIMHHHRYAKDYGWQSFEKVFTVREDGRTVLRKLKPLLPDMTTIMINKDSGNLTGLVNKDVFINLQKTYLFTYDIEGTDYYGRSIYENIANIWHAWTEELDRLGKLIDKNVNILPIIQYPEGQSEDIGGSKTDHYELAEAMLSHLSQSRGVCMPNTMSKMWDEMLKHPGTGGFDNIADFMAWQIKFLETKPGHLDEITNNMEHLEKLMVRGMLVPERSVIEATASGSRADSNSAADMVLTMAKDLLGDIMQNINWHIVDQLLVLNFGEEARGKVYLHAEDVTREGKELLKEIIVKLLTDGANADVALRLLAIDDALDQLNIQRDESIDDIIGEARQPARPQSDQAALVAEELGNMEPVDMNLTNG